MKVRENPSLRNLNTFGLDATAGLLLEIENEEDLLNAPALDPARDLVLGGGSNVVLVDNVPGTVFLNRIRGIAVVGEDGDTRLIEAGAGENWHGLVEWSLAQGLSGLENLSLIPGSTGAAPIQNIGAYGVELESVLDTVTCWDWRDGRWVVFDRDDCRYQHEHHEGIQRKHDMRHRSLLPPQEQHCKHNGRTQGKIKTLPQRYPDHFRFSHTYILGNEDIDVAGHSHKK